VKALFTMNPVKRQVVTLAARGELVELLRFFRGADLTPGAIAQVEHRVLVRVVANETLGSLERVVVMFEHHGTRYFSNRGSEPRKRIGPAGAWSPRRAR
jgi:hypothetical protein